MKNGNGKEVKNLSDFIGDIIQNANTSKKTEYDLSYTEANKELIESILNADKNINFITKNDVLNKTFILLSIFDSNFNNTKKLLLFKDGKLYSYMTSSVVLIDKLTKLPLQEALRNGHIFEITITEKKGKSKRTYLDAEVKFK